MQALLICIGKGVEYRIANTLVAIRPLLWRESVFTPFAEGSFFDWLFNVDMMPVGVEFHCGQIAVRSILDKSTFVDHSRSFPTLWFGQQTHVVAGDFDDWEDYYWTNARRELLIMLNTHNLNTGQTHFLAQHFEEVKWDIQLL